MSHANRLVEHNTNLTSNKRKHRPVALHIERSPRLQKILNRRFLVQRATPGSVYLNVTLLGGLCEQAILSVTPDEILAQAVSPAVRCASCRVVPAAVAQAVCPRNSMQTSQRN